jgi:hypothetical protein
MLPHHGPYDYSPEAREESMARFDSRYREQMAAQVKRHVARENKHASEIISVMDRMPYSTTTSMAYARLRAYEAAGLNAHEEEKNFQSRVGKRTSLTKEAQKIQDQKDSDAYETRVAKRLVEGRVKAGPFAPGNHFEERIDQKALNDRVNSDDARLKRHFHQHQVALLAEEHRHSAIEDKMVLQEMTLLQKAHRNELRSARMDGSLPCAQDKIDHKFQNDVENATEHHMARLREFKKLESQHANILADVDEVEKMSADRTKSYLTMFNEAKKPEMRGVFESFASDIGTTLSTADLPIKKKKEKKPHATNPVTSTVLVVETVDGTAKASKKKKKGQSVARVAADAKMDVLTEKIAQVVTEKITQVVKNHMNPP